MAHTILVIDDNAELRDMMQDLLFLKGYSVKTARSGHEGLLAAETERPDLIICDIAMPGMNGFQVLDAVRAREDLQEIPFVFLTASMTSSQEEELVERDADGFLAKPYQSHQLYALLDRILRKDDEPA